MQTVELTSKVWKALQLTGALMVVGSCGSRCVADRTVPDSGDWINWLFGGIVLYIVAKVAGWWHHG